MSNTPECKQRQGSVDIGLLIAATAGWAGGGVEMLRRPETRLGLPNAEAGERVPLGPSSRRGLGPK